MAAICKTYLHAASQPKMPFQTTQALGHSQGVIHRLLTNMSKAAHLNWTLKMCISLHWLPGKAGVTMSDVK